MIIVKETTKWSGNTPNHTYKLNDSKSKCSAYMIEGTSEWITFKKPIPFSTRGRSFHVVETKLDVDPDAKTWSIKGTSTNQYVVTKRGESYTCTCPAAMFRKLECKHIIKVKSDQI